MIIDYRLLFSLIADRQFELVRVADAAIDIYAVACVLSRYTFSAQKGAGSLEHEKQIAELFCEQVGYLK